MGGWAVRLAGGACKGTLPGNEKKILIIHFEHQDIKTSDPYAECYRYLQSLSASPSAASVLLHLESWSAVNRELVQECFANGLALAPTVPPTRGVGRLVI